ncbi:MAG: 1-acyl-sn-glycerol-3-phosphate acyltransferase [Bradymonadia bacterium]
MNDLHDEQRPEKDSENDPETRPEEDTGAPDVEGPSPSVPPSLSSGQFPGQALQTTEMLPSAMIPQPGALLRWLGRRLFTHVNFSEETTRQVQQAAADGQLVYVARTHSTLDYLCYNHIWVRKGLPLARFANGMDLRWLRGVGLWLSDVWGRLMGKVPPDPPEGQQLLRVVQGDHAALIFLRRRRRGGRVVQSDPGFFEGLVRQQRQQERPILLVPQHLVWPRTPPSKRRTWVDILFGDRETPGRLRKLAHFFVYRRQAQVSVGTPINLKDMLVEHAQLDDRRLAQLLRRVLYVHLAQEAMVIHGPHVKPWMQLQEEILSSPVFQKGLLEKAQTAGIPDDEAEQQAYKDLRHIGARTSFTSLVVMARVLDFLFNRIYDGVEVDTEGLEKVKQAMRTCRSAPLILVPSHKSHIDYLVISWVLLRHGFVPPHIAAGANLSFFPLGPFFRMNAAFFLKRSFKGLPLYRHTFRAYLWKLAREGYPVEFFIEGGRSRTGKLLPPKLGMLSMLLEGIEEEAFKDLQLVPINLSYERVVESASYTRELTGGEKSPETMKGVMRAGRVLRHRYGRVYVSFEAPVRVSEWLEARGVSPGDDLKPQVQSLGFHMMRRIQEATVITPSALVATICLSHHRRGISEDRVRGQVGFLVGFLLRRGARLSRSITTTLSGAGLLDAAEGPDLPRRRGAALTQVVEEAVDLLAKARMLHLDAERNPRAISVPHKARIELDYYRNALLGLIAPETIVATALNTAGGRLPWPRLAKVVRDLSWWLKREFIYQTGITFDESLEQTVRGLAAEGLVTVEPGSPRHVQIASPQVMEFLQGALLHLLEGYWIAADTLRVLVHGATDGKAWLAHAREQAEREFVEGDLRRAEAASTAILKNALAMFVEEGLVTRHFTEGRRGQTQYTLAQGNTLEDVAYRRDDLGQYLVTQVITVPASPPEPPAEVQDSESDAVSDSENDTSNQGN